MIEPGEVVLDTSAWVALLADEPHAQAVVDACEGRRLVTTPIVLAELAAQHRMGRLVGDPLPHVEAHARLESLARDDAVLAADVYVRIRAKARSKIGLADALIYATAHRVGALYVTLDSDLEGEAGVNVVSRPRRRG